MRLSAAVIISSNPLPSLSYDNDMPQQPQRGNRIVRRRRTQISFGFAGETWSQFGTSRIEALLVAVSKPKTMRIPLLQIACSPSH